MCSSTDIHGHTYRDAQPFSDQPGGRYVDGRGQMRQWQECTGCGNVTSRTLGEDHPMNTTHTYAVGVPLIITVSSDGAISFEVDLSEVEIGMDLPLDEVTPEVIGEHQMLIDERVAEMRHHHLF